MRKAQKKQAEGFVNLLEEAHEEIVKSLVNNQFEIALDILEQCHEGAIQLGTLIEKAESVDCVTIGILEEYCEVVFNIHKQIATGEEINAAGIQKVLKKHYLHIENSVNNDIKVRKEILFLPYKVAMWDCLEPVWQKVKADLECDVYVMPIPYYNKLQDESLGEMLYEGKDFPEYVEITHYRDYDIEKRRPDVIYIHNPYDEFNSITNVHPCYYSCRIHSLTDMLVYIPYFVAEQTVPHQLRVLPGTLYSHKVILSCENEKRDYIEGIEEWLKNNPNGDSYEKFQPNWRDKFVVEGSPKYEKVLNTKRDIDKLPEEWKNKIYREDGSRRKVLFYNTTISAMIHKDNMLEKIKRTLEIMEAEDDVVLWWRPHPLYESSMKNIRPEWVEEYKRIVEEYKKNGIGIFDDTPDLNRAIAESDAYYGDGSSVMYLFQKVNKPVMIQNVEI